MNDDIQEDDILKDAQIIIPNELKILVTQEDINGDDILAMSDFFSNYIHDLRISIQKNTNTDILLDIPAADFGMLNEVLHRIDVVSNGTTQLIPDFDHLPKDIKEKYDSGIYKIGESRQVDGNLRAVIVDENGNRVKDITLREAKGDAGLFETSMSLINQLQLRQIFMKLDAIQELQSFQIDRDRDRDIKVPFFNARPYILKAQSENCSPEEKKKNLEKAADFMLTAINNIYTEMSTSVMHLSQLTRIPIFRIFWDIKKYIRFAQEDLQIITKFVGLRMQILDYMGDADAAGIELDRYQNVISDFFCKILPGRNCSAAELIHMNYPYNNENRNCWYQLKKDVMPRLESIKENRSMTTYIVSIEE